MPETGNSGWYWYRERLTATRYAAPKVVPLITYNWKTLLFLDGRLPMLVDSWPGRWAGPIPFPEN